MKDATLTMDRRRFLTYSSAMALSSAAPASSSGSEDEPLVIGYRGTEEPTREDSPDAPVRWVSARSLRSGDLRLARTGVRIGIEGLCGTADQLEYCGVRSALLHVRFHPEGASFSPWSFTSGTFGGVSRALEFFVPVDHGLDLSLELDQHVGVADRLKRVLVGRGGRELFARLDPGQGLAQPKLREGLYSVPLRQEAFSRPGALAGLDTSTEPCVVFTVRAA